MTNTICKNWEVNYVCQHCGVSVFNATEKLKKCPECGGPVKEIHPINSRKEKKWQ